MFDWLKNLFRGKRKRDITADQREYLKDKYVPGPDIIGRQSGQKRNRVHIYCQLFGYPIRICDWIAVDHDQIEYKGNCQGMNGPADDLRALAAALDHIENMEDVVICKHCRRIAMGKRGYPYAGVPIPGRVREKGA